MSLTDFINEPNVKEKLNKNFPNKGANIDRKMKCKPKTDNYSLIGMAFDYLARFIIEYNCNNVSKRRWIAENTLQKIKIQVPKYSQKTERIYNKAKEEYDKYLRTGKITDDLIKGSLDLSRIELFFRSQRTNPLEHIGYYKESNIQDFKCLINLLKNKKT